MHFKRIATNIKIMNIEQREFPYLDFLITDDNDKDIIEVGYCYGINESEVGIRIDLIHKNIRIYDSALKDIMEFIDCENFKLHYKKIDEPPRVFPQTIIPFDKLDLYQWLVAFNQLSKHNKLKNMIIKKNQLIEIVDNL